MNKFKISKNLKIHQITESALLLSIYISVNVFCIFFSRIILPFGGSISPCLLVIAIACFRINLISSIMIMFIGNIISYAILGQFIIYNPWQFILDWFCGPVLGVAFGYYLAKFFLLINKKQKYFIAILIFIVAHSIISYISAVTSGYLFFSGNAPQNTGALVYSLTYNAIGIWPTCVLSSLVYLLGKNFFDRLITKDIKVYDKKK